VGGMLITLRICLGSFFKSMESANGEYKALICCRIREVYERISDCKDSNLSAISSAMSHLHNTSTTNIHHRHLEGRSNQTKRVHLLITSQQQPTNSTTQTMTLNSFSGYLRSGMQVRNALVLVIGSSRRVTEAGSVGG
jgi:hypothetical protein